MYYSTYVNFQKKILNKYKKLQFNVSVQPKVTEAIQIR